MNKWKLLLGLAVALQLVLGFGGLGLISNASTAAQAYTLDWCVVGGSGDVSTQLSGTVGQTTIGWSTGTNQLGSGFWYGVGAGGGRGLPAPHLAGEIEQGNRTGSPRWDAGLAVLHWRLCPRICCPCRTG